MPRASGPDAQPPGPVPPACGCRPCTRPAPPARLRLRVRAVCGSSYAFTAVSLPASERASALSPRLRVFGLFPAWGAADGAAGTFVQVWGTRVASPRLAGPWGGASPSCSPVTPPVSHVALAPQAGHPRPAPPAWGSPSAGCRCGSNPQPQPEPPRRLPLGCSRRSLSPPDPPAPPPLCTQQTGHQGRVSRRNSKPSGSPLLPGTCEPPHVRTPVSPCHGGAAFLSRGEVLRTSSLLYAGGTV